MNLKTIIRDLFGFYRNNENTVSNYDNTTGYGNAGMNYDNADEYENPMTTAAEDAVENQRRMIFLLQTLCASIPDGKMLVDINEGELNICMKWDASKINRIDNSPQERITFSLNGKDDRITLYEEVEEEAAGEISDNRMSESEKEMSEEEREMMAIEKEDKKEERAQERKRNRRRRNSAELKEYLERNFRFRYNVITEQTEWAQIADLKTGEAFDNDRINYQRVDNRSMNTIIAGIVEEGSEVWDRDVKRKVENKDVADYHPFTNYFDHLPEWDGIDRVTPLAGRISTDEYWTRNFHRWMLAVTAQWTGRNGNRANSVSPILISTRQGIGKSTFCRMLMPKELNPYFTESYDLDSPKAAETKLATFGLINLDEFDKLPERKMPLLKNLMQMERLNIQKAYRRTAEPLQRIASFIGTSNRRDLLTDATGSRRFICMEIDHEIDCSPIDHAQLYAQLKHELENGGRYWFTKEEEEEIQRRNKPYYANTPAEDVFRKCFRPADAKTDSAVFLTAAEIYEELRRLYPAVMRSTTADAFSRKLPMMARKVHTKYCNGYYLIREEL